jgi:hypothetical protein
MRTPFIRIAGLAAIAAGLASVLSLASGCYVEPLPPPVYVDGPQYYDGYVVYYDSVGRPYYYANGGVVWVSPASPFYFGYVNHWRVHGGAYYHWNANYGYRYRGYRRR